MFLGVDIGGTRSRWCHEPSHAGTPGAGGGAQPAVEGVDAAALRVADVLRQAVPAPPWPRQAVVAMAGVGEPAMAERLAAALRQHGIGFPVAVVGDVLAAAAAALADGPGLLLWSGTGSFAVARSAAGELVRVGGRGYLLGDQGSGYDLVRRAAAAALLAVDGLGPPTRLVDELTRAFGAPTSARIGAMLQRMAPGEAAHHLPVVLAAAAGGDEVAQAVLHEAVDALVGLGVAALRRAGLEWAGCRTALGGGVLQNCPAVLDLVRHRLATLGAAPPVVHDVMAAARGAAGLARAVVTQQQPQCAWVAQVSI